MKNLILILLILFVAYGSSCKRHSLQEEDENIYFLIIETNISQIGLLQKNINSFRPENIRLPDLSDLEPNPPPKPMYWYRTKEGEPRIGAVYNSPEDTIGKNIVDFREYHYVLNDSGLESAVNSFDDHYCLVVRQFVSRQEAEVYKSLLIKESIIVQNTVAFPISADEYFNKNLNENYDNYIQN